MRKLAFILPLAGLLVGGSALAAQTVSGVVAHTNPAMGTVSVVGGGTYRVSEPNLLRGVYSGEHVIITMNDNHTIGLQEDSNFSDGSGQQGNVFGLNR
jgi:TPP-dependent trihydroxycyclohexane-1,2-dione (THcHDO) dehydratase